MTQPTANAAVQFSVLHQDDRMLVLDKPAGVVTEPGLGHRSDSLLNGLIARWPQALTALGERRDYGMLHRLDRDTSGALLVALDAPAYDMLRAQFESRAIRKRYLTIVEGRPASEHGTVTLPLSEVRRGDMKVSVIEHRGGGEPAITHYRMLGRGTGRTLLQIELITGRLHQIRVHMTSLGCPVVNDRVYRVDLPPNTSKPQKGRAAAPLALHAWTLDFTHPGGKPMTITAPIPEPFKALLKELQIPVPSAPVP